MLLKYRIPRNRGQQLTDVSFTCLLMLSMSSVNKPVRQHHSCRVYLHCILKSLGWEDEIWCKLRIRVLDPGNRRVITVDDITL